MPSRFFKILIFVAGFIYLHAAFEISNNYVKNTWGDEYDTYVHSDQSANTALDFVCTPVLLSFGHFANFDLFPQDLFYSSFGSQNWRPPISQKTYLKNSALLI